MRPLEHDRSLILLVLVGILSIAAEAQSQALATAWEKQFANPVDWYVRTSSGVLLVRAGQSLTALDGVDGRQLWSLPQIEIGGSGKRGKNLLEIPGLPILLVNRAKTADQLEAQLLALDLWTGTIRWQKPELDDLLDLVPFYDSGRVLLVTRKTHKPLKVLTIAQHASSYYVGGPYPFRAQMFLLDPVTGQVDWSAEYPRVFSPAFIDFREWDGQVYLHECLDIGGFVLGRVDLKNGQRLWEFTKDNLVTYTVPPALQFASGRVIFAAKDVFAFDPSSKKPVWAVRHLGKIHDLVTDRNLILGAGDAGAFAVDSSNGRLKWRIKSEGRATNPLLYKKENALVFCDKSHLVVVDADTGKVLRRTSLEIGSEPQSIRWIGEKFVLAMTDGTAAVYNVEKGQKSGELSKLEAEFPPVSFVVDQHAHYLQVPNAPADLRRQLQDAWDKISAMGKEANPVGLTRLRAHLTSDFAPIYGNKSGGDSWKLWQIDPGTGTIQQFALNGSQPDASSSLGLAYTVKGDRLRAMKFPTNQSSRDGSNQANREAE
jgi:outer membrane protein assembly factor BamB